MNENINTDLYEKNLNEFDKIVLEEEKPDKLLEKVIDYIESKIDSIEINQCHLSKIKPLLIKFEIKNILNAIEKSKSTYIKCDSEGCLLVDSVDDFFIR